MNFAIKDSRRLSRRALATFAVAVSAWFVAPFFVALPGGLLANPDASPVFRDRHGVAISQLPLRDSFRSAPVTLEMVPSDLIACTVAAEDKRFHDHGGVDLLATARAARDLVYQRRIVSGASTITQQLIKISSPPAKRSPATKLYEIFAARRLEMKWSKQQILTAYLNRLDYGNLRTGAAEATRFYFQKPLADLSLAECALLAGLPQAPSRLNPLRNPGQAIKRRNTVLHRLAASGKTDPARIISALAEPITLRPLQESQSAPWLAFLNPPHAPSVSNPSSATTSSLPAQASPVSASALHAAASPPQPSIRTSQPNDPDISYLKYEIFTTLDLALQKDLEAIVRSETSKLKDANLRHAAAVVIHNPTGEILALVSSADWDDPRGGQINGALAPRSPGSTLKPFTYLLAMERNHRIPASVLADVPSSFRTPQGLDLPENYDRAYRGPVTLRSALACSLNIPAMRELNALGGPAPLHELLTQLGITTLGPDPTADGLGLTVGNAPVRLLELTNAYATLARGGHHIPPRLFTAQKPPPGFQIPFSTNSFYLLADIMSDASARAPSFPPGGPLDLPFRCAVKTGTSSDFRDNWCIGYTPEFTVGVWAGNFENQPMKGISGITGAAPVFHRAMLRLHRDQPPAWFERPDGLTDIAVDCRIGKLVTADSKAPSSRIDLAPNDRVPPIATAADYDPAGKAILDPTFTAWFESRHNFRRGELAMDPSPALLEPLKVITPANGITLLLDPEIPAGSDRLRPVTNLPGTARWASPTLRIEPATPEPVIHLAPGTHTVTATDPRTGISQIITLHVKAM